MLRFVRYLPAALLRHRPLHLTVFLTSRCNMRCSFCFYRAGEQKAPLNSDELAPDEIESIFRSTGRLLWAAFSGGEIFLRTDLPEIARRVYDASRPAVMLFPTNGLLTDRIISHVTEILQSSPKSIVAVKISIDGINKAHDKLRGHQGAFEKAVNTCRGLAMLKEQYPSLELGVNTVFCSQNQHMIHNVMDYVKNIDGVSTHTVSLARGSIINDLKDIDAGLYTSVINRLRDELRTGQTPVYSFSGARVKAAQDVLQRDLILRTLRQNKRLTPCYAGKSNIVVTENGDVYPCEILNRKLGNVRDYGCNIARLMKESPGTGSVIKDISEGKCHCTHECNMMTNILFNPMMYPRLIKEYLRLL